MNRDVAGRALSCLGTPFRMFGRTPGIALDCVGLAGFSAGFAELPYDYTIRGDFSDRLITYLTHHTVVPLSVGRLFEPGAIALVNCGPRQQHLMVRANAGWVHAHAGLGRVVHMAGASPWPVIAAWQVNRAGDGRLKWQQ